MASTNGAINAGETKRFGFFVTVSPPNTLTIGGISVSIAIAGYKLPLLASHIGLVSALTVTAVLVKRVKRRKENQ